MNLDLIPFGAFHRRLLIYANIGLFCDGYILSSIGLALTTLGPYLKLSAEMTGLVGAMTLFGILLGALIFGRLGDIYGRRALMIGDLALFVVASILHLWVTETWQILVLRFVLGVAIGADYPLAAALIAELMPTRLRGAALNSLQMVWFLGACAAYLIGYALLALGPQSWRWILVSPAIFAGIGLMMRASAPESPRWLASQGRTTEARQVLVSLGYPEMGPVDFAPVGGGWRTLLQPPLRRSLLFVSAMWLLQVVPLFAILTFVPLVLTALKLDDASSPLGSIAITAAFLVGSILSIPLIERCGRRPLCIWSFGIGALAFLAIGSERTGLVIGAFLLYAVGIGAAAGLELVYPAELFPTVVRGTATGFAAAVSRVGAFVGTFLLPIAMVRFGVRGIVIASMALCLIGLAISIAFAPETRGSEIDSLSNTA